jgi:hypothetical protein
MRHARRAAIVTMMVVLPLLASPGAAVALARAGGSVSGGAQAPSSPQAGGSEYGVATLALATRPRPMVSSLSVPSSAAAGRPPRVTLRIDEVGVATVNAQLVLVNLTLHQRALAVSLGWIHTGRTVVVRWPRGATLGPGSYQVSLRAHDHRGGALLRRAQSSGGASLKVLASAEPSPAALPNRAPTPPGSPAPAQSVSGAVFPVQGPHSFGDAANRFGAGRAGHTHQGQDVLAGEGLPVVAPLAGTILRTGYQAASAGYYAVEHTGDGFDFFFAHCESGSLAVQAGTAVLAGQALCKVGQTGDATGPHLHFEMWVGGWQAPGGYPIDPLPYLQAWDQGASGA